jgi:hypothetical protein
MADDQTALRHQVRFEVTVETRLRALERRLAVMTALFGAALVACVAMGVRLISLANEVSGMRDLVDRMHEALQLLGMK